MTTLAPAVPRPLHLQQTQFRLVHTVGHKAKGRATLRSHGKKGNRNRPGESWPCEREVTGASVGGLQGWLSKGNFAPSHNPICFSKKNCGVGTKLINIASCLNNPTKKPEFSAQKRWPVPGQHV